MAIQSRGIWGWAEERSGVSRRCGELQGGKVLPAVQKSHVKPPHSSWAAAEARKKAVRRKRMVNPAGKFREVQ